VSEAFVVSPAVGTSNRLATFAIALILGSHVPLLLVHFQTLWRWKPHYQCVPLLVLAIGWLIWQRRPRPDFAVSHLRLANPLLLSGLATLTASVLLFSPWLAAVAFVLSAGGLMAGVGTTWSRRDWLPVWALMWLWVPPPLDWDEDLIRGLQAIASRGCGPVLDVLGVLHLVEGNVLVLPGHRLLVAEACSGINSLFTLLIATALFVVVTRRPLVWSLLLLAGSVGWAAGMNVLRLVTVAVAQAWFAIDISTGWRHETLGFVTVGLALAMILSTDRLLAFFLEPIAVPAMGPPLNSLSKAWNWCLSSQYPGIPRANALPEEAAHGESKAPAGWINGIVVAGFVLLGVVQLSGATLAAFSRTETKPAASVLTGANLFHREDLPKTIGDWTQVQYGVGDYDPTREIGAYRQIWVYQWNKRCRCMFSADYPFGGWHNLSVCYVANGWRVVDRTQQPPKAQSQPASDPYVEVGMVGSHGEQGLLLFSLVSPAGRGLDIPEQSGWKRIVARFAGSSLSRWLPKTAAFPGRETTLQVQALVSSPDPLQIPEREAVRQLFVALRHELVSTYTTKQAAARQ
jgi:exosortase